MSFADNAEGPFWTRIWMMIFLFCITLAAVGGQCYVINEMNSNACHTTCKCDCRPLQAEEPQ